MERIDRWERECNEIIDDISSKSYSYEFEADADIRKIVRGRDGFGRKLEALIKDFDEKAGKIIRDESAITAYKELGDYEESVAHIESCKQKLDEVIRLEKEEEARRLETEA